MRQRFRGYRVRAGPRALRPVPLRRVAAAGRRGLAAAEASFRRAGAWRGQAGSHRAQQEVGKQQSGNPVSCLPGVGLQAPRRRGRRSRSPERGGGSAGRRRRWGARVGARGCAWVRNGSSPGSRQGCAGCGRRRCTGRRRRCSRGGPRRCRGGRSCCGGRPSRGRGPAGGLNNNDSNRMC